jgi:hypothetical protein
LLAAYTAATQATATAQASYIAPTANAAPANVTDQAVVQQLVETNLKLAAMQKELERLRTEQQAQTGAIITSNAQVVNANAETVSSAVENTQDFQHWYGRQVVDLP